MFVRIQDTPIIQSIVSNATKLSTLAEFWYIASDGQNISVELQNLLMILLDSNIPGLFLSPRLEVLPSTIQSQLGILECSSEREHPEYNITVTYPARNNLSLLVNSSVPQSETINLDIKYQVCIITSTAYVVANLELTDGIKLIIARLKRNCTTFLLMVQNHQARNLLIKKSVLELKLLAKTNIQDHNQTMMMSLRSLTKFSIKKNGILI